MCGRYASTLSGEELGRYFHADEIAEVGLRPSWNIAPTSEVPIVLEKRDDRARLVTTARWSLVPPFATELTLKFPTFNARSETVTEKPTFRHAVPHQRALLPADAYYEWHTEGKTKTPYAVTSPDGELAFASLFSWWRGSPDAEWVLTATILTMAAPEPIAWLHDRTPVVLAAADWDWWLNRETTADQTFIDDAVARSIPVASRLTPYEVAPLRGDGAHLLDPVSRL
jgi:putative SOS response-associated peptidase YedK